MSMPSAGLQQNVFVRSVSMRSPPSNSTSSTGVQTVKYNLNRLKGLSLIFDEEQEQLGQLATLAASNAD
jgi:hypothetical protein